MRDVEYSRIRRGELDFTHALRQKSQCVYRYCLTRTGIKKDHRFSIECTAGEHRSKVTLPFLLPINQTVYKKYSKTTDKTRVNSLCLHYEVLIFIRLFVLNVMYVIYV